MINKDREITIFSNGVHLQTIRCVIEGVAQWRWVAVGFEDDSYLNGEVVIPNDYSDKLDTMLAPYVNE